MLKRLRGRELFKKCGSQEDSKESPVEAFPVQLLKKVSKKAFYEFLVDRKYLGWFEYAMKEPGCLPALFEAFTFILQDLANKKLTLDLIKGVHKHIMTGVKGFPYKPGEFRTYPVGYRIENVFFSQQIFEEFCQQVRKDFSVYGACISIVDKDFLANSTVASQEEFAKKIDELSYSTASLDGLWDAMQEGRLFYRAPASEYVEKLLQVVCNDYNKDIQKEKDPINKLKIIAHARKRIIQIHGFPNGNGRTSSLLLQRLLIQNGFPPVVSYDRDSIGNLPINFLVRDILDNIKSTLIIYSWANDYEPEQVFSMADMDRQYSGAGASPELKQLAEVELDVIENYYKAEEEFYKFIQSSKFTLLESQQGESDIISLSDYINHMYDIIDNYFKPPAHECLNPTCGVCNGSLFKLSDTLSEERALILRDEKIDKNLEITTNSKMDSVSAVVSSVSAMSIDDRQLKTEGSAETVFFASASSAPIPKPIEPLPAPSAQSTPQPSK